MRKFLRITYYLGGVLLFILIAIVGYTQTRSFKTYLRNLILHQAHTAINGQLQLGDIEGNLITGFTMDGITVSVGGMDLFSAQHIDFEYDPFGFLFNRAGISNAVIKKPYIYIYRSIDGTLNITHLIKPQPKDTTSSIWTIDIKRIELADAEIIFTDSLLLYQRNIGVYEVPPNGVIDYARVHLKAVTLVASAQIQNGRYESKIMDFRFVSQTPDFTLDHFSGDISLTNNEVSARNVRIETPTSHLRLDAGLKGVDITRLSKLEELKLKPVDLSLTADNINTKELKQFLYPSVDFLDKSLKLHVKASGTFGELNVEQIAVQMPNSSVQLQGQIRNLHHPHDLEMTMRANDNFVAPRDLLDCLPGLEIPDLTYLGTVRYSLTYEGRPLDFKTHVVGSTNAGDIDVDGKMEINSDNTFYTGTVAVRSLALGTILKDANLTSSLNARMTIDGTGFDPHTLTGLARIEMDSSSINGLPIGHSVFVFDFADGLLRSHVATSVSNGNYEFSSNLKFFQQDSTNYSIIGKIRSLDLADLLNDQQYRSDMSFDLTANGAIGASTRFDTTALQFYQSSYGTETFETAEAKAVFNMRDGTNSSLQITSTIGNLNVNGNFTPASFIAAWDNSYRLVTEAVAWRFRNLDSLRSPNRSILASQEFSPSHVSGVNPIEAQFNLVVKDLKPVGAFIHVPLAGQGSVVGKIVGDSLDMQLGGSVHLQQFGLRSGTDTLNADTALFHYSFGGISHRKMFENFRASIKTDLGKFDFNDFLFNSISGQIKVESDSSNFQLNAYIDSTARVDIQGTSRTHDRIMELDITTLKTEIGNYTAENIDTVRLALGSDGFRIRSFAMAHEKEKVALNGHFSPSGMSDLNMSLNGFSLSNLKQILHRGPYAKTSTCFGGTLNATALFRGSFKNPNIVMDLQAEGVRADDSLQNKHKFLGKIDSHVSYFEHMLNLLVKLNSRSDDSQSSPDLMLSGSLPYEFVLAREAPHKLEGNVNLAMQSTGMNLEFLDPFIPDISNLTGMMSCDMRINGPIDAPRYEGTMSIQNANFVFNPLGMPFVMNGDLIPAGDRIRLERFTVQNIPKERSHVGIMNVSGNFTLLGLKIKQFDFLMQGNLKMMSEDKRIVGQQLYGNLFAATGPNGLHWQGDLTASMVRGDIFVKDAQLVLPPDREFETLQTSVVNVTFKDDTSLVLSTIPEDIVLHNGRSKSVQIDSKKTNGTESLSPAYETVHSSFLDGISYDVGIETQGPTTLRFVFNTQTSEELYADMQGRLYFNRTPAMSRLTGQVEVGNRSYYNFIKRFEATGKLLFTGDVLNPELDVKATYQGTHDTTATQTQSTGIGAGTSKAPQVLVTLHITGTRNAPKMVVSLQTKTFSDKEWTAWKEGDDEANAVSYIIAGQFRNELTDQQRMGLGTNLGFGLASGMASGILSDIARRSTWGYIQSMDVIYSGGQLQSADLRLSGQYKEMVIRAGGRVLTGDFGNTNVSIELPMSFVMGVDRLRNLILTFERRVEDIQNTVDQRRALNGARLFYRFTF